MKRAKPRKPAAIRCRIESVDFTGAAAAGLRESAAVLVCSCGAVTTSGEWERHRGPIQSYAAVRVA